MFLFNSRDIRLPVFGLVHAIIIIDIGILTMHIFTISFPTSLQVLVGGIVPRKLGTGFNLGSLVGGVNKIYDPDRFDLITKGSVAVVNRRH